MASLTHDADGSKRILFLDATGKRRTIRLGKLPKKHAERIHSAVESLLAAKLAGVPVDHETARWLGTIDGRLSEKLAYHGLTHARPGVTIACFIDGYIERRRKTLKPWTVKNLLQARQYLTQHFGESRDLRNITFSDAEDWRCAMLNRGLADNTVRRATGRARQLFKAAFKRELIECNPFDGLAATIRPVRSRDFYITKEQAQTVLDYCPDAQWRCLFALARYGGLRTPSETLMLMWGDIDRAEGRFTVTSPKTEHHDGKGSRIVPLFPELMPHLREAFEQAAPCEEYVISRYRDAGVNLRSQLLRIHRRAGLQPWPKLWQNLRATRATELAQSFPAHVAAAWLGHSVKVAADHYLQVTDGHFEKAAHSTSSGPESTTQKAAHFLRAAHA